MLKISDLSPENHAQLHLSFPSAPVLSSDLLLDYLHKHVKLYIHLLYTVFIIKLISYHHLEKVVETMASQVHDLPLLLMPTTHEHFSSSPNIWNRTMALVDK